MQPWLVIGQDGIMDMVSVANILSGAALELKNLLQRRNKSLEIVLRSGFHPDIVTERRGARDFPDQFRRKFARLVEITSDDSQQTCRVSIIVCIPGLVAGSVE